MNDFFNSVHWFVFQVRKITRDLRDDDNDDDDDGDDDDDS